MNLLRFSIQVSLPSKIVLSNFCGGVCLIYKNCNYLKIWNLKWCVTKFWMCFCCDTQVLNFCVRKFWKYLDFYTQINNLIFKHRYLALLTSFSAGNSSFEARKHNLHTILRGKLFLYLVNSLQSVSNLRIYFFPTAISIKEVLQVLKYKINFFKCLVVMLKFAEIISDSFASSTCKHWFYSKQKRKLYSILTIVKIRVFF